MSISVSLRRISNLPGRSDRKVELTFRGRCRSSVSSPVPFGSSIWSRLALTSLRHFWFVWILVDLGCWRRSFVGVELRFQVVTSCLTWKVNKVSGWTCLCWERREGINQEASSSDLSRVLVVVVVYSSSTSEETQPHAATIDNTQSSVQKAVRLFSDFPETWSYFSFLTFGFSQMRSLETLNYRIDVIFMR